jgi:hypothetical protein
MFVDGNLGFPYVVQIHNILSQQISELRCTFDHGLLDTKCEGNRDCIRRDGGHNLKNNVMEVC